MKLYEFYMSLSNLIQFRINNNHDFFMGFIDCRFLFLRII